jgi:tetratricopeptide (TPR) repeat protein/tRNA A-37 threonylcarbamoyl transferase component Bud32
MPQPDPDPIPTLNTSTPARPVPQHTPDTGTPPPGSFATNDGTSGPSVAPPTRPATARYRRLRPLGKGGLGEVHVALDEELNREVALKEIQAQHLGTPATVGRFLLEAEVTGRLEHPGVVPVYGLGAHSDGRPFYAMRLIKGESFKDAIAQFHETDKPGRDPGERSLAFRALLRRFVDVCNAVAYAHSKRVLHRDLKPGNVMLGPFGETLIIDWGLAKVLGRPVDDVTTDESVLEGTRTQTAWNTGVAGTPAFMAPEQAEGRLDQLGPASDVYSLGAILYVVLTGRTAFNGSREEVMSQVRQGEFTPPRRVTVTAPPALDAVCLKAMALQPRDRYSSAQELAADVEHWLADEPVTAYREALPARLRRWGRRHRGWVGAAAALVLTATAALAVGLGLVEAERSRTARANSDLTAALERETKLKGDLGLALRQSQQANASLKEGLARETTLKGELETALEKSRTAEANAAEQRQLALDTMTDVIHSLDDRLKDITALGELRKELLGRAKKGLEKVARAADTAGQIDHGTVWVHLKLGDISRDIDGSSKDAKAQYDRACELAQRLADAEPGHAQSQRDLSVSHQRLGDVQLVLGDTRAALDEYRKYREISQKLADADPLNARDQRGVALSHEKLGDVQLQLSDTKAALDNYRKSNKIFQRLADADPDNAEAQRDLSVALQKMGDVQLRLSDTKAALAAYRKHNEISQTLADADLQNSQAQRDLALSHQRLGDVRLQLGDTNAALEAYRKSNDLMKKLADADPRNARVQRTLSVSHQRLGDVQLDLGDAKGALEEYRKCYEISQNLAHADPSSANAQRNLSLAHNRLGDAQMRLGDTSAALEAYRQSHELMKKLADGDPRDTQAQRDLSVSHDRLGNVQLQVGDIKGALEANRASLAIRQKLANSDPSNVQAQCDLAVSHTRLGDVQLRLGDTRAALEAYRVGLDIRLKLADADPRNAQAQRDLLVSHVKLGLLARANGDFAESVKAFEQALDVARRADRPDYFGRDIRNLQRELSLSKAAAEVVARLDAIEKQPPPLRPAILSAVAQAHVRRKQPAQAVAAADRLAQVADKPDEFYNAACVFALLVPLTDKPEEQDKNAARSVVLLKQAIAKGYKDAAHMKQDRDLDALRERDDFKSLLKEVEAKPPK